MGSRTKLDENANTSSWFRARFFMRDNKKLRVRKDLRRRKLIEPVLFSRQLVLPFLDSHIDDKANDTIDQSGYDPPSTRPQKPDTGDRTGVRADFFEGAVGSFRY